LELSVIIPTYDRQQLLTRAIKSVDAQDFKGSIIVVDDASLEPVVLPTGLRKPERVKLVRRAANGGAAAARNTGLAVCSSPLITFLDSDDFMLPGTLAPRLSRAIELGVLTSNPIAVGCGWIEIKGKTKVRVRIPREPQNPMAFAGGCWVSPGSSVIFNRASIDAVGPFDEQFRRLEDVDYFLRFSKAHGNYRVDRMIAVAIEHGSYKNAASIYSAISELREKHRGSLPSSAQATFDAYVALERARIAKEDRAWWALGTNLFQSIIAKPRLRLSTGPGWETAAAPSWAADWP
jgi:glycosyltransferase involved in cell wall biosynthesis